MLRVILCSSLLFLSVPCASVHAEGNSLLEKARNLARDGHAELAADAYGRILSGTPDSELYLAADQEAERLLRDLPNSTLEAVSERSQWPRIRGKAALILELSYHAQSPDCVRTAERLSHLASLYSEYPEGFRASVLNARGCLLELWRDREAIESLERFARSAHTPTRINALFYLGDLHYWRGERERAREAFETLLRDYTRSYESLSKQEKTFIDSARLSLALLERVQFSPTLDRSLQLLRRFLGLQRKPADPVPPLANATLLAGFSLATRLIALLAIVLLAVLGSLIWPPSMTAPTLLEHHRSLGQTMRLLGAIWMTEAVVMFAVHSVNYDLRNPKFAAHAQDFLPHILQLLPMLLGLFLCMRRERMKHLFVTSCDARLYLGVAACSLALLGVSALVPLLTSSVGISLPSQLARPEFDVRDLLNGWSLLGLCTVVLMGPTVEELIYRGVVLDALRRSTSLKLAGFLSASLFAMVHLVPLHETLALLLTGLLLNQVRDRFSSLFPCVTAHALVNAVLALI